MYTYTVLYIDKIWMYGWIERHRRSYLVKKKKHFLPLLLHIRIHKQKGKYSIGECRYQTSSSTKKKKKCQHTSTCISILISYTSISSLYLYLQVSYIEPLYRDRLVLLLLQTTSTATTGTLDGVGRDGSHILNTSNLHASTSQSTEGSLCARSRGLGLVTAGATELDVEGSDTLFLTGNSNVLYIYKEMKRKGGGH